MTRYYTPDEFRGAEAHRARAWGSSTSSPVRWCAARITRTNRPTRCCRDDTGDFWFWVPGSGFRVEFRVPGAFRLRVPRWFQVPRSGFQARTMARPRFGNVVSVLDPAFAKVGRRTVSGSPDKMTHTRPAAHHERTPKRTRNPEPGTRPGIWNLEHTLEPGTQPGTQNPEPGTARIFSALALAQRQIISCERCRRLRDYCQRIATEKRAAFRADTYGDARYRGSAIRSRGC